MAKYIVEYQISRRVLVEAASKLEAAELALQREREGRDGKVSPLSVQVIPQPEDEVA
jgi:hypothetical protein